MEPMKNEENTKITVQNWLDYLNSEKEMLSNSDQATTPRLLGSGALLVSSIVSIFQEYPYNVLGGIGSILSVIFLFLVIKKIGEIVVGLRKIRAIQLKILFGKLQEVEEIAEEISSEFGVEV